MQKLTYKQGPTKKRNAHKNNLNEFQLKQSDDQKIDKCEGRESNLFESAR